MMKNILICFAFLSLVGCKKKEETLPPCTNFMNEDGKVILQGQCNGVCTGYSFNLENCGSCGNSCSKQGKVLCINGECSDSCQNAEEVKCNSKCVITAIDQENCGACGIMCAKDEFCGNGKCVKSE